MNWIQGLTWQVEFLMALIATWALYLFFKKRDELGKHSAQNTAATLTVAFGNMLAALYFVRDINAFMQEIYAALGIPTLPSDTWEGVPFLLTCLIGIAAKDFADYWSHRIMHTRWGWPTHAAHHSDTHVNAFSVYRIHFLEIIVMALSYIILLTWLQMPGTLPVVIIFYTFMGFYTHMDLDFDHGPFRYVLASPVFHRWHHADVPEAYGKNLANVLPIYDVIFGTYYHPGPCKDVPMGALKTGVPDKNPFLIYIYPFQEWARLIREDGSKLVGALRGRPANPKEVVQASKAEQPSVSPAE
ncbi:sterol desaturase family protein [Litoreibacter roseus]|uniref:Fatty acid hydroxylase domain-containing protein n=1 Tax=Litoreibacter roseus TaxID=2601869 RepID=A0A6N6JEZ3_9RHOB|nr:sterol desaturase family protein [Litoreibacter roseus]GFE64517.1 hypothetical protein KIN_15910 [Litoreibacter roseus]